MSIPKQPITVAIADIDRDRRTGYELLLRGDLGVTLLTDVASRNQVGNDPSLEDRRLKSRENITAIEDEVARVKRLKPLVLVVNLDQRTDEDYALLLSLRREQPEALMVILVDDSVSDGQLLQVLEIGARGYLKQKFVQPFLSKAVQEIGGAGGVWVPRKMLGDIMDLVLNKPVDMTRKINYQ